MRWGLGRFGAGIGVRLFARVEGAGQADAEVAIDVVVAWDDEEAVSFEVGGGEEFVEEGFGDFVFGGLAGMGDVAGGEDEVWGAALVAVVGDGLDEGAEDDVAVIGVAGADV